MKTRLSKSQETFLRNNYKDLSIAELSKKLQISPQEVQSALKAMSLIIAKESVNLYQRNLSFKQRIKYLLDQRGSPLVVLLSAVYTAYFFWLSFLKYTSFAYHDFDLAIHIQTLWNILHGSFDLSILGVPFFGNHAHFIHFLLAPFYWVFQSPLFLLFLQSLALGAGAIPLYLMARAWNIPGAGLLLDFAYLLYPAMGYMNLYEFHPTALSTFFLLWVCWSFQTQRFASFWIWSSLAILCQENLPLVIFMFGPLAWLKKMSLKWILSPVLVGAGLFFFLTGWFLPTLNKGLVGFESLYAHLGKGPAEIIQTIIYRPFYVAQFLFRPRNFEFLGELFFPVAFLSFIRPTWLIPAIPLFLQHLLSARETEQTILYHYTAELIPFIFLSALAGSKALINSRPIKNRQTAFSVVLLAWTLTANLIMGPHFSALSKFKSWSPDELDEVKRRWVEKIPPSAPVMCTFEFLPHLANRYSLYSFHHFYSGRYTLSAKEYTPPKDTAYLLVDTMDHLTFDIFLNKEGDNRFKNYLQEGPWGLIEAVDSLLFFERGKPSIELWNVQTKTSEAEAKVSFEGGLQWYDLTWPNEPIQAGTLLSFSWKWGVSNQLNSDYWIKLEVRNNEGIVQFSRLHPPGYHMYPVHEWKPGEIFEEKYSLRVPIHLSTGNYTVHFLVIDRIAGKILPVEQKDNETIVDEHGVSLGKFRVSE